MGCEDYVPAGVPKLWARIVDRDDDHEPEENDDKQDHGTCGTAGWVTAVCYGAVRRGAAAASWMSFATASGRDMYTA